MFSGMSYLGNFRYWSKSVASVEKTRTICTYCGVGCKEVATEAEKFLVLTPYEAEANKAHLSERSLCIQILQPSGTAEKPDDQKEWKVRGSAGKKHTTIWSVSFRNKRESWADAIADISSQEHPIEENYLMQKFIRAVIGTNNIDCCARVCHSPTALGMQRAFGTGAATNSIEDLDHTDCI